MLTLRKVEIQFFTKTAATNSISMANPSSDPATEKTSPAVTTTTPTGSSPKTGAVHPNRRRIIKAAPPKTTEAAGSGRGTPTNAAYSYATDDDSDDGKKKKHHGHHHHHDDDDEEDDKTKRLKNIEKRGKALREKELQERRKSGPAASNLETADASANPFSRFKSIFSVEPQFPEHKRSLVEVNNTSGSSNNDNKDGDEPEEKRLKPSDDDDNESPTSSNNKHSGTGGLESLFSSKAFWATVVVAVGVAFVLQRGRKK